MVTAYTGAERELADEAYAVLDALTTQYSPRDAGSDEEMGAALSLYGMLSASGYDTSLHEFGTRYTFRSSYMFYTDTPLESGEDEAIMGPIRTHLLPGPPASPPRGFVTGQLTPVGDTSQMDISERDLEGKIALILPGTMTGDEMIQRVTRAGAVGAIIISDADDNDVKDTITIANTDGGSLPMSSPDPRMITVVTISTAKGNALLELLERGDVTASIMVDMTKRPLWNVVAERVGTANGPPRQVILGAHYDTVEDTQGASDNGSGLAVLMTIARHIAERDYPFDVRIVLFGAEEEGLLGSKHYVETMTGQEIDGTIAMLNFDAAGVGNLDHSDWRLRPYIGSD